MGFFEKIKQGLSKTASSISSVFTTSELDDDFFLLSQGEEGEMREAVQGDGGKQRVNRTNFVIKCLEVGTAFLRFL